MVQRYTHIAEADVLHEGRVEPGALSDLGQQRVDQELQARVLEAALLRLGQRRADRERDDDVVGILGLAAVQKRSAKNPRHAARIVGGVRHGHGVQARTGVQVLDDGTDTLSGHGDGF